ncbi:unnamed protein product [Polarella glacialis]|uniref:EF-hand domain-containing protein n=1 Tax=Polarella glacialis TaxID=89957 RepID=A0A813EQT8_POLGL|nr:unnamed protein product [Polarella glacialis]
MVLEMDSNQDGLINRIEWSSLAALNRVSPTNAELIFQVLDVGEKAEITVETLRLFRGRLALCDYAQLVQAEFGSLYAALLAADTNGDLMLSTRELKAQSQPLCLNDTESLALHSDLDFLGEGFVDLRALGDERMPFQLHTNGSLAGYRACLQSYFSKEEERIVQDLERASTGFPATSWGLADQGARVAWQRRPAMELLFHRADPFDSGFMSRERFSRVFVGFATPVGLRLLLSEVAPDAPGAPEIIRRADLDSSGSLSMSEFEAMARLLGLRASNAAMLFSMLNFSSPTSLGPVQLRPVSQGPLTFAEMRLLALGEFPGTSGQAQAFDTADKDRSKRVDFVEFAEFAGVMLAVTNFSNLVEIFDSVEVYDKSLNPDQFNLLTATEFDLPILRRLIAIVLGRDKLTLAELDTSQDGYVDLQEFQSWALLALNIAGASVVQIFEDLDVCGSGRVVVPQLAYTYQQCDVIVFRALLASRYQQQDFAVFTDADSDNDGEITKEEFLDFAASLLLSPSDGLALAQRLDFDGSGTISKEEMRVASANSLRLFDFRRLASVAFKDSASTFVLADYNRNGLVTLPELQRLSCERLMLRGNSTPRALFQAMDKAGVGAVTKADFDIVAGDVTVLGLRHLVQSVWSTASEALLLYDSNGDRQLQLQEFLAMGPPLAASAKNMEALFTELASRSPDVIEWDIYHVAMSGLAEFRVLIRERYSDPQKVLLDIDTQKPWNLINMQEFAIWCRNRFQLPEVIAPELFQALDTRGQGNLDRTHLELLVGASVGSRVFGQLLESAFDTGNAAFDKVDFEGDSNGQVSLKEMLRLGTILRVEPANVAALFTDLDVEKVGFLTPLQFRVMAKPNYVFRLSNLQQEDNYFGIYEMKLYKDLECLSLIQCDLPMSSGHYVQLNEVPIADPVAAAVGNGSNGSNSSDGQEAAAGSGASAVAKSSSYASAVGTGGSNATDFQAARAFDGYRGSRWVSECQRCLPGASWIGCKFDEPMQVRCVELYLTPEVAAASNVSSRRMQGMQDVFTKVAAGFRMETWTGKAFQKLVDIVKPPLWEIGNLGEPLTFKPPIAAAIASLPEVFQQIDEKAAAEFEKSVGLSSDALLAMGIGLTFFGLLCCGICFPMIASPRCLNRLRVNAPERMDLKRSGKLDQILGFA